jgi:hypothetical protein
MPDEQDTAEALDDEMLDSDSDIDPDFSSENDVEDYPPERYLGAEEFGTTEAEMHVGESVELRTSREEPDPVVEALDREALIEERQEAAANRRH